MEFNNTPNKSYKTTCGKTIWHSRNVAVAVCLIRTNPLNCGAIQVLGVKRGSNMTHAGKFCFPCGYLDWDETIPQAAVREVYEETGIKIKPEDLDFCALDSSPTKFNQNVSVHFLAYVEGGEPDLENVDKLESEEVLWIDYEDCKKYDWAFDHLERIEKLIVNV